MTPDHRTLWQQCLNIISGKLPEKVFNTWFTPAESLAYADGKVSIGVPSESFVALYESDEYYDALRDALRSVYGPGVKIEYTYNVVSTDPTSAVTIESSTPSTGVNNVRQDVSKPRNKPRHEHEGVVYEAVESQLNPVYNFENYCVGDSNRLAYTIAENLGSNPGNTVFNPFFLYGKTGVGKTHLVQAVGIRVKEKFPRARVLYTTSRTFENQYGIAVRDKKVNEFINYYQGIDVLLIDDIQELSGKAGTQNAFYPIFNYLHQKGKILVMTSDRPPVELDGIMDRLISRFKWGVIEVLPTPDLELRKQILRRKSAKNGLNLSQDVIDVIAAHVTDSVRELEGVVISLITRATLLNQEITPELAQIVMQSAVKLSKRKINFDMIVEATASHFNIDVDVIFSRSRLRDINDARQMIMYLAHRLTDLSSKSIGYKLNRTHVTVLHGIKSVADRIAVSPAAAQAASEIEHALQSTD